MDRETREALAEAVLLRCKTHYDGTEGRVYLISNRALVEAVETAVEGAVFEANDPDFTQTPPSARPDDRRDAPG